MSIPHISANLGEIAKTVIMPGDPLRAKYIAETFLESATEFNHVPGMPGFTGTYRGKRISAMGSGSTGGPGGKREIFRGKRM